MLTEDESKLTKSIYRSYHMLDLGGDGAKIYLGTSTGFDTKVNQAERLCSFMKLQPWTVVWYDDDSIVYSNS